MTKEQKYWLTSHGFDIHEECFSLQTKKLKYSTVLIFYGDIDLILADYTARDDEQISITRKLLDGLEEDYKIYTKLKKEWEELK